MANFFSCKFVTTMGNLAHYLKQGDIDKIQKAFIKSKNEEKKEVRKQFALLTSKSFVISLSANTNEHCDRPHSTCFVSCIHKLKACYGIPIRIISNALHHYNVKPSTNAAITEFVETLEQLREAEFAYASVDTISSSQAATDEWTDLQKRSEQSVNCLKQSKKLELSGAGVVSEQIQKNALDRLKGLHHYGILSVHVALLGLANCTVDELRSIPGIVVVFPTWVTLRRNLRDPNIVRIFEFIRERHSTFDELMFEDCVPLAPFYHHVSELKMMQNIPVWEWGRIAVVHAWIIWESPTARDVKKMCHAIHLKQKYTEIMARLAGHW